MKKFDLFLVLIAAALIGMGYYFSKGFRSETEQTLSSSQPKNVNYKKRTFNNQQTDNNTNKSDSLEQKELSPSVVFIKKYIELKKCLSSEDCGYSQEDPRSYELEALTHINVHLSTITEIGPFKQRDALLKDALRLQDGHIKATILAFLTENNLYNSEWRDLILDEYISFYDSKLIPDAMEYFKKFSSAEDKRIIHNRIYKEMANGSPMVGNALANHIKQLLDQSSLGFYKTHLSGLEEGPIKDSLVRQLKDYEMLQSAG